MQHRDWRSFAIALKKELYQTHRLDRSDSNCWKIYRTRSFERGFLPSKPEIIIDKNRVAVYLCGEHTILEQKVEQFLYEVLGIEIPRYNDKFDDRKEYYFK